MLGRILWETPLWWDILKHLMMFVNAHSRPAGSAKTLCLNTHAHGALMSAKLCLRPGMTSEERRTCCRAVVVTLDKDVIQFLWHQLIKPSQRAATLDLAELKVIAFCCSWGTETCFQQLLLLRRRELVTDNKCPCCVSGHSIEAIWPRINRAAWNESPKLQNSLPAQIHTARTVTVLFPTGV